MKQKIILEIDGVRHKLIRTKSERPCKTCSLHGPCQKLRRRYCEFDSIGTHFRKCKKGE